MKRSRQFLAAGAAAVLLLTGCGKLKDVDTTSVYVDGKGVVTEAIVDSYSEKDSYTGRELKRFVEEEIASYRDKSGREDSVKLVRCKIGKDTVQVRLEYADDDAYAGFHKTDFFAGTVEEAKEAGYDFSASFLDSEGKEISLEKAVSGVRKPMVIICEEPLQVVTARPVLCVSSNARITGEKTARTGGEEESGEPLLGAPAYVVYGK